MVAALVLTDATMAGAMADVMAHPRRSRLGGSVRVRRMTQYRCAAAATTRPKEAA